MLKQISKTKGTKQDYIKRAILLQRKALKDLSFLFEKPPASDLTSAKISGRTFVTLNINDTVDFACEFWADTVGRATWRYYRASLVFYAESLHASGSLPNEKLHYIKEKLKNTHGSTLKFNRTSTQKKKYLHDNDLNLLTITLEASTSKYAEDLLLWLHANCLVGLRPCEWQNTEIVKRNGKLALMAHNAKTTNGRGHGKTRIIYISHLDSAQRELLSEFSSKMKALSSEEYKSLYEGCRRLLQYMNKKLWKCRKKNITLYSARHQFSADLKRSGASPEDVAYLMGHCSTATATSHYGKRRYGRSIVKPEVDPELKIGIVDRFKPFKLGGNSPKSSNTKNNNNT